MKAIPDYFSRYIGALHQCLDSLIVTDLRHEPLPADAAFERLCALSADVQERGGRQYLCGNGASAAFANHMALDWTKNGGVPTYSFSDASLITAMGNDLGYDEVFAAPLGWYGRKGDLLLTISSSGNSPNILRTIAVAREQGLKVVTLSGLKTDNQSRQLGDLNFYVPAKTYGIVECAHQVLLHVWLDRFLGLEEWNREAPQNMRASEYQA
ncbi:MAG: SIS domain-containing protein [Opitutales bacterium]